MFGVYDYQRSAFVLSYTERYKAVRACTYLNRRLPYDRYFVRCQDGLMPSSNRDGAKTPSVEEGLAPKPRVAFLENARSTSRLAQDEFAF